MIRLAAAALLAALLIAVLVSGAGSVADGLQASALLSLPDSTPGRLALVESASLVRPWLPWPWAAAVLPSLRWRVFRSPRVCGRIPGPPGAEGAPS